MVRSRPGQPLRRHPAPGASSVVYWIFALTTHLNIGHRHLLPIYPALCILCGGAAFWIQPLLERSRKAEPRTGRERRRQRSGVRADGQVSVIRKAAGIATLILVAWHALESVNIRPELPGVLQSTGRRARRKATSTWPTVRSIGDRTCRRSRSGWTGRASSSQAVVECICLYFGTARPEYLRHPCDDAGGIHRSSSAAGSGAARRRRLLHQRHCSRRHQSHPVQPGTGEQLPGGTREPGHLRARIRERAGLGGADAGRPASRYWQQLFTQFDQLRTGRLVAFLRGRDPDAMIGYSILIYRLTDADVALALNGPPP